MCCSRSGSRQNVSVGPADQGLFTKFNLQRSIRKQKKISIAVQIDFFLLLLSLLLCKEVISVSYLLSQTRIPLSTTPVNSSPQRGNVIKPANKTERK